MMKLVTTPEKEMLISVQSPQTDCELWNAFRLGCSDSYRLIYQRYFFDLYTYGLKITSDRERIKDVIQDLFIQIWKSRQNLANLDNIKPYLMKSLKRKLYDLQLKADKNILLDKDVIIKRVEPEKPAEQQIIQLQQAEQLQKKLQYACRALTKRETQAIQFKFYQDLSYTEIASQMTISVPAAYNIISKALSKLKNLM